MGLLEHPSWQVRAESAEALHECTSSVTDEQKADVYAAMIKLLDDPDGFVISRAVITLQSADIAAAVEPMVKAANNRPEIAPDVVKALAEGSKMRASAAAHLRKFCQHPDAVVRAAAIVGLCQVEGAEPHEQLRGLGR